MSLQVWLPLNGNLNNQGLSNVTASNNGAVINNNGKIGKCYEFNSNGANSFSFTPPAELKNASSFSFSCWIKILSWNSGWCTFFQFGLGASPWNNYIIGLLRNSSDSDKICFTTSGTEASSANACSTGSLQLNTWYHIIGTYDKLTNKQCLYVNGVLNSTYTPPYTIALNSITSCRVGALSTSGTYQTNSLMNDLRIYDHCLTDKEVKELARGLVLHYPLSSRYTQNLIANSATPSGGGAGDGITASTQADGSVKIVAVSGNGNYKSVIFKGSATTDSNIENNLSKGDIYTFSFDIKVESGTAFPTVFINDGNSYVSVGNGNASKHDIWQRVYVIRAYSGRGASYGYMALHLGFSGAIGTYYVKNFKMEKGANYYPVWNPAITDDNYADYCGKEYDVSGYSNNGVYSNEAAIVAESPVYYNSQNFSNTTIIPPVITPDAISVSFWMKRLQNTNTRQFMFTAWNGVTCELATNGLPTFAVYKSNYPTVYWDTAITVNSGWVYYCGTFDTTNGLRLYINGELVASDSSNLNPIVWNVTNNEIGRYGSYSTFQGLLSDFRIYSTALSASDIQELYQGGSL